MYPALSVILFSTLSGAGYGLLFLICLAAPAGLLPAGRGFALLSLGLALALVSAGLAVSALHLHHPERAWRAFSQWRSSWLSREGVAALATYVPALVFGWLWLAAADRIWLTVAGIAGAAGAAATVYCTARIYATLGAVQQWCQPLVTPVFLGFALMSGGFWLLAVAGASAAVPEYALWAALALAALAWGLKWAYWRVIDRDVPASTPSSAIGLHGQMRVLDPPHTEDNYLLKEMGYRVARKHARKLRRIALLSGFGLPAALGLALLIAPGLPGALLAVAALANLLGVMVERWLFFAEATHTVTLYYGR